MTIRFHPRRLGHVNLWVHDLERSIRFYETVCGIALVRRERDILIGFHSNGNTHHDIGLIETSKGVDRIGRDGTVQIPKTRGVAVGLNHLGWEMESEAELVAAYQRALATTGEQYRALDHLISHSIYLSDPDGNGHEFYADAIPDWRVVYNLDRDDEVTAHWDPLAKAADATPFYIDEAPISRVDDAPLHPSCLCGATIATSNFEAMWAFFAEVAGLAPLDTQRRDGKRHAQFAGGVGRIDLTLAEVRGDARRGLQSFTFELDAPSDLASLGRALNERTGIAVHVDRDERRDALTFDDPDGFALRFVNPLHAPQRMPA